jgi:hypothetical protein
LVDILCGVVTDALDDVGEIGLRVEAIELWRLDDGEEDSGAGSAGIGAEEGPVSAAKGQWADSALSGIVGHFETAIEGVARQRSPACEAVSERLCQLALLADPAEVGFEEGLELREQRHAACLAGSKADIRGLAVDLALDGEQRADLVQRAHGDGRFGLGMIIKNAAACVRPAGDLEQLAISCRVRLVQLAEAGIAIGMQIAAAGREQGVRVLAFAIGRVVIIGGLRVGRAPRLFIAHDDPELALPGLAASRIEDRDWRIVGVDAGSCTSIGADRLRQRRQQPGHFPDPTGHGRSIEVDALARVDLGLAVERGMIAIFGDDNMGNKASAGSPAFDR